MYLLLSFGIFSIQIINRWPFHLDPVKSFSTPSFITENFYSSIKFSNWHFFHIGIISGVHPYIPCHTLHSRQKIMCTIEILPDLTFGSVLKISRYEIMCTKINTWNHSISNFSWKICVKPLQLCVTERWVVSDLSIIYSQLFLKPKTPLGSTLCVHLKVTSVV